jgi:hypothetical protein
MDEIHGPEPSGNTCGFFSTRHDLQAYGCYPEGRTRGRMGHAFRFIDALERHLTAAAHMALVWSGMFVLLSPSQPCVVVAYGVGNLYPGLLLKYCPMARPVPYSLLRDKSSHFSDWISVAVLPARSAPYRRY